MRAIKVGLTALVGVALFASAADMWLASARDHPVTALRPAPADEVVFRARHYRTTGPCLQVGNAWAMPVINGFEVVEVVRGRLPAPRVEVRPMSQSAHLDRLGDGQACTLRLVPSPQTREQLRRPAEGAPATLWVDGGELRVDGQAQ